MEKINTFLKEHRIAIFLALLTSLIVALPQVFFRIDHKEFYQDGVEVIELFPDSAWAPRIREVQDGYINFGSIYYKDGKDDPYLFQPLGSIITAYTGKIFGLGINNTFLLQKIIYSFCTFLLIYLFVFYLSRHTWIALTSASVILLAEPILYPAGLKRVLTSAFFDGTIPISYVELAAPSNPAMIFIFLFGFLVTFWQYYQKRNWRWGVISALLLGLNVYTYFYSATYLFAFLGVLGMLFLIQKRWSEVRSIAYVFLGGIVTALPYVWNLYNASLYPAYADVAKRFALIASHTPQFIGVVAFLGLVVFLLGFPREDKQKYIFCLSLLLTPLVTLNQQIITGKVMQAGHYHWYMHKPIVIIFTLATIFYLLSRLKLPQFYEKFLAVLIIAVSLTVGLKVQLLAYSFDTLGTHGVSDVSTGVERQKYAPVMHWLNLHAEKDTVVFGNPETSRMIVIYTPLNVFHFQVAHVSLSATDARIREQMFTYYRLRGVNQENVQEVFYQERTFISAELFGLYYRDKSGHDGDIPDEVLNSVVNDYIATLSVPTEEWLYTTWSKYEVEHLVWDRKENPDWNLDRYPFLTKKVTLGDFTIYSFLGVQPM